MCHVSGCFQIFVLRWIVFSQEVNVMGADNPSWNIFPSFRGSIAYHCRHQRQPPILLRHGRLRGLDDVTAPLLKKSLWIEWNLCFDSSYDGVSLFLCSVLPFSGQLTLRLCVSLEKGYFADTWPSQREAIFCAKWKNTQPGFIVFQNLWFFGKDDTLQRYQGWKFSSLRAFSDCGVVAFQQSCKNFAWCTDGAFYVGVWFSAMKQLEIAKIVWNCFECFW